jgi:hypothetical protein
MRIACLIETVCRAVLSVLRTITADITAPPSLDQECTIPELLAHRAWNPLRDLPTLAARNNAVIGIMAGPVKQLHYDG